jgi:hypothetical protein
MGKYHVPLVIVSLKSMQQLRTGVEMHEQYSSIIELAAEEHVAFVPGHSLWSEKTAKSFWVALVRLTHVSAQSIVILVLNQAWVVNSSIPRMQN